MHISTKINIFLANFVDFFCFAFKSTPKILAVSSFKTLSASMSYRVLRPPRDGGNGCVLLDAEYVDSSSDLSEHLSKKMLFCGFASQLKLLLKTSGKIEMYFWL